MSKTYIADKETLDSVKKDTRDILENIGSGGGGSTGGAVKSVQTGAINAYVSTNTMSVGLSNGTTMYAHYIDVTISEVDVSKAVVICSNTKVVGTGFLGTGAAYLLDSTTLRVIVGTSTSSSYPSTVTSQNYTRWQVVEFN